MRQLTDHIVTAADSTIRIHVTDEPGAGGGNHRYEISGYDPRANASAADLNIPDSYSRDVILFQNGPVSESGVNGITQEVLLAIVADRLRSFQAGPFRCKENACALTHIEEAMHWLQQRTISRMRRGVEGKSEA